jgi:hypothetical protein
MLANQQNAAADLHNASHLGLAEGLVPNDMREHGDDA